MIPLNKLRVLAAFCAVWLMVPPGIMDARTRNGDKLLKLGAKAEALKEYDKALDYYQQALKEDPKETSYELAARRARFESGTAHIDAGNKLQKADDLEKALAEYQKAFNVDPGSMIALQNIQKMKELLDQKAKGLVPPGEKPLTSAERAQKDSLEMIASMQPVPELKPVTN